MTKRNTHICLNNGFVLCNTVYETFYPDLVRRIHINFLDSFIPKELYEKVKTITPRIAQELFDFFPAFYICRSCLSIYVRIKNRGFVTVGETAVNPATDESYTDFKESFNKWIERQEKETDYLNPEYIPKLSIKEVEKMREVLGETEFK